MNFNTALRILNLNNTDDVYNIKKIKKHYHFLALKYHPDKNNEDDNVKKFQEINEAYLFLLNLNDNTNETENNFKNKKTKLDNDNIISFNELLKDFVGLLNIKNNDEIDMIKNYFEKKYKYYNNLILSKLSNNSYFNNLFNMFNDIDNNHNRVLIINTRIENVLNNEIYKLELYTDDILFIPLWYKEITYKDILIKIKIVDLNDNIIIDNDNNIFINIDRNINEIIDNDIIFTIGSKEFLINNNLIYIRKNCNYKLDNCGIINPYCDISDIYDGSSHKSNVFVNLTLYP